VLGRYFSDGDELTQEQAILGRYGTGFQAAKIAA
jgi:hypothetical protein